MKKKALAMAVLAALSVSATALANPVDITGKFETQYRYNTDDNKVDGHSNDDGFKTTLILNATTKLEKNLDLYARFATQHTSNPELTHDFFTGGKNTAAIDQFGFVLHEGNFNYKIGRQDASIGSTAILYNTNPFLGRHIFADGITATGKSGVTDLKVIALKEDRQASDKENKVYALAASYSPAKNWNVGATLGKYDYKDVTKDTNHWAVNADYTYGKASYWAEFAGSNADTQNGAYGIGVSYAPDAKNSFYMINYKIEKNADMNGMTDYESGWKGFYYGYNYKVNNDTTLKFFLRDMKGVTDSSEKNTSFRTTVSINF